MIIDPTDFTDRPYKIPNQEEARDFISFIEEKEEELAIQYLLGAPLWEEFREALEDSGVLDEKWELLRDGGTYTHGGTDYEYKGWVDLVRPAIFSEWIPMTTYKLTNIGFVENSAPKESKLIEDQYPFIVHHWNKFVTKVGYNYPYGYNCRNTFYGFMKANEADFDTWSFRCPKLKNRYDF